MAMRLDGTLTKEAAGHKFEEAMKLVRHPEKAPLLMNERYGTNI
jgi:hypothetical protein